MLALQQDKTSLSAAMNAKIIGSGDRPMVMAHGFGGDQTVWDKILPVLSESFKILVFDWLFSGAVKDQTLHDPFKYTSFEAYADTLINLMEEMKFGSSERPVVFVGHSMSGMIGCAASVKCPQLFQRLVLIGASPSYINTEDYKGGFDSKDIDMMISNIGSNYEVWSTAFASLVVGQRDSISSKKFEKCLKRMRPDTALALAKFVFGSDERDFLCNVSVPCHIIQAENDAAVPTSVAYYMDEKIKGESTVDIIGDAEGHFPQMTSHVELLDVMRRVLGS